jgi:asparagine synthase (glutamine-hydrolysing)
MKDRLPPGLLARPKKGFSVPLREWFRGPLRSMLHDLLLSRRFLDRGIVSEAMVSVMLKEHMDSRRDNSHVLWSLLVLERWFDDQDSMPSGVQVESSPAVVA